MKPNKPALAIHHIMAYKVQTHMFFMSYNNLYITKFIAEKGRIIQPKAFKQNELIFPPKWSMSMSKITGPCIYKRPYGGYWRMKEYQSLFPKKQNPCIRVKNFKLKENI